MMDYRGSKNELKAGDGLPRFPAAVEAPPEGTVLALENDPLKRWKLRQGCASLGCHREPSDRWGGDRNDLSAGHPGSTRTKAQKQFYNTRGRSVYA